MSKTGEPVAGEALAQEEAPEMWACVAGSLVDVMVTDVGTVREREVLQQRALGDQLAESFVGDAPAVFEA